MKKVVNAVNENIRNKCVWVVLEVCVLFGLLVSIFEGVVCQRCFVARILHHVVPCDQSLANGCSPWLKTLLGGKKTITEDK